MLLLLGQGLGPVPPDQAGGEPPGVPHGTRCLRGRPAQAGSGHDGEDEADAHLSLHSCGEKGKGSRGAAAPKVRPAARWGAGGAVGCSSPAHGWSPAPLQPS